MTTKDQPGPISASPFPFKRREGEDDHRIVAKQTRFRLVETAQPKGSWSRVRRFRHTNEACLKHLSLSLSFSFFPSPFSSFLFLRRLVEHPSRACDARLLFLVSLSRSKAAGKAYAVEGRGMIRHASATRLQSIWESLFLVPCGCKSSVDPAALGDSR